MWAGAGMLVTAWENDMKYDPLWWNPVGRCMHFFVYKWSVLHTWYLSGVWSSFLVQPLESWLLFLNCIWCALVTAWKWMLCVQWWYDKDDQDTICDIAECHRPGLERTTHRHCKSFYLLWLLVSRSHCYHVPSCIAHTNWYMANAALGGAFDLPTWNKINNWSYVFTSSLFLTSSLPFSQIFCRGRGHLGISSTQLGKGRTQRLEE